MTREDLYQLVTETTIHVASRQKTLRIIEGREEAILFLYDLTFQVQDKQHVIASVLLEELVRNDLIKLTPFLDDFLQKVYLITNESTKRLISKLCRNITYSKEICLTKDQKDSLVEVSLYWLVSESKVATEVFAMEILMKLKEAYSNELHLACEIIEKNYPNRTIAYQIKAKKFVLYMNS